MQLTKQQIKKANKLLKALCETEFINGEKVYPFFDSEKEAEYICSVLEERQLLIAHWYESNKITRLASNEYTCNAVATNLLDKEFSKDKKSMFSNNLTFISLLVSVVLNILLIGNQFRKSNDPLKLKANLDACMIRELKLNHIVDSLNLIGQKSEEKIQAMKKEVMQLKEKIQN